MITDFSEFIEEMKIKRGLSYEKMAEVLNISPQGLHSRIKKRKNSNWKIEYIIALSQLLKFEFKISNGIIEVKENDDMLNNETTKLIINEESNESKLYKTIVLDNGKKATYNIFRDYGDYSIATFYTPVENVNYDDEPELMEEGMYYDTIKECLDNHPNSKPLRVYGLINNEDATINTDRDVSIFIHEVENRYFLHYAKALELTEDGFDVVYIDTTAGIKLIRVYAELEIINHKAYVTGLVHEDNNSAILGLVAMPIKSNTTDKENWQSNIKYFYEKGIFEGYEPRYFDGVREEILEGFFIRKVGYQPDVAYLEEYETYHPLENAFEDGGIYKVYKYGNDLHLEDRQGINYPLKDLNLLRWQIIR